MKITINTDKLLQIIQPDRAHKAQTIIFLGIGSIGSLAVIMSGEGLVNGVLFYILLILGVVWFYFGGKADKATFDKTKNELELVEYKGLFSKPVISLIEISGIIGCELDGTHSVNPAFDSTNRKAYAIIITMNTGKKINILPYTNGKKRCENVFREVERFLKE